MVSPPDGPPKVAVAHLDRVEKWVESDGVKDLNFFCQLEDT